MADPLADHISADPDGRGYVSMTDAQVRDDLLAQTVSRFRAVPVGEIAGAVMLLGVKPDLKANAGNDAVDTLLELVRGQTALSEIDYRDPTTRSVVGGLLDTAKGAGALTQDDVDALTALGSETVTKAADLGHPDLTERQVYLARGGTN